MARYYPAVEGPVLAFADDTLDGRRTAVKEEAVARAQKMSPPTNGDLLPLSSINGNTTHASREQPVYKASSSTSSPEIARTGEEDGEIEEAPCSIGRRRSTSIPDASVNTGGQHSAFVPLHEDKTTGKHVVHNIDRTRARRTDKALTPDQDALSERVLEPIREYIKDLNADGNLEFSLMALIEDDTTPGCIGT
ncbi:hypothetical protein ARMGADRAFT_1090094 [Armillaria gallica]|uniref:Uncharacterized protein n=1 Tax=Armillaria gallica TaxID=47427 RepID=A0A2H3D5A3_ARMGA|nr:hypothetical protein ARMGADRAFT_1090094 [Armillaria gallica]